MDRRLIAYHAAGHAIVQHVEIGPVELVTIDADDGRCGNSNHDADVTPDRLAQIYGEGTTRLDRMIANRAATARVRRSLAGYASEDLAGVTVSLAHLAHEAHDAPTHDMTRALSWARVLYGDEEEDAVRRRFLHVEREWKHVREWLARHRKQLDAVVDALVATGALDGRAFAAVVEHMRIDRVRLPPLMLDALARRVRRGLH